MPSDLKFSDLVDLRERLMQRWEAALEIACQTGYWKDVRACAAVMDAFHEEIRQAIEGGEFAGDAAQALAGWEKLNIADLDFRRSLEAEARLIARKPHGNDWWTVLGVAPNASDELVKAAYLNRLQEHHAHRDPNSHPLVSEITNAFTIALGAAYAQSRMRTPGHFGAQPLSHKIQA